MMTPRERFNKALSFEHHRLDRLPLVEWAPWWDKTTDRWQQEGLKPMELLESQRHFGLDPLMMISAGAAAPSAPAPAMTTKPVSDSALVVSSHGHTSTRLRTYACPHPGALRGPV